MTGDVIADLEDAGLDLLEEVLQRLAEERLRRLPVDVAAAFPGCFQDFLETAAGGETFTVARFEREPDVHRLAEERSDGRVSAPGCCRVDQEPSAEVLANGCPQLVSELEGWAGRFGHEVEQEQGRLVLAGPDRSHVLDTVGDDGKTVDGHVFFTGEHEQFAEFEGVAGEVVGFEFRMDQDVHDGSRKLRVVEGLPIVCPHQKADVPFSPKMIALSTSDCTETAASGKAVSVPSNNSYRPFFGKFL